MSFGYTSGSTAVPVGPPRPSSITHPEDAPATVTCSYIVAGTDGFLAGAIWYTTRRRRSVPPWGTHGPGGVRVPYFFPLENGRSPVSHLTCEVPCPPRRSGKYRKGMIPARPLYQGAWGSVWDSEPSKERVGDWGGPAAVWSLLCVAETRATRPNGEWGYSTRRQC